MQSDKIVWNTMELCLKSRSDLRLFTTEYEIMLEMEITMILQAN